MPSVRYPAVRDLVSDAIANGARGVRSALARACDVTPSAVQRWADGYNAPAPEHWSAIEDFFGWESGRLAKVAGYAGDGPAPSIAARLDALEARVAELEAERGADVVSLPARRAAKKGTPTRHEFPEG